MSAEADLRTDLLAHAPLAALVGTRVAVDKIEQGAARPFIVYTRQATESHHTLDNVLHAQRITFELQVWADTRASAEAVADATAAALAASTREPNGIPVEDRSSAYDPDTDLEAVRLVIDWWVTP